MKCKIWNTKKNAWERGFDCTPLAEVEAKGNEPSVFSVSPREDQIICWWTGELDNNEKEIYQGDLLKGDDNTINEVFFSGGEFYLSDCHGCIGNLSEYTDFNCEVVGNKFEHPDLLK